MDSELEYQGDSIAAIAPDADKPKRTFLKRGQGKTALAPTKGKKPGKGKVGAKSRFKANLNPSFFANAHSAPVDEVKGWSQDIAPVNDGSDTLKQLKKVPSGTELKSKETEESKEPQQIIDNEKAEEERKEKLKEVEQSIADQTQRDKVAPFTYEIYAIMIHSGTAYSGHYSAFIKDYETKRWYHFDDSRVRPISVLEIPKVFGTAKGRRSTVGNAYMLMYRLIEQNEGEEESAIVGDAEIPDYLYKMVMEDHKAKEEAKQDRSI